MNARTARSHLSRADTGQPCLGVLHLDDED